MARQNRKTTGHAKGGGPKAEGALPLDGPPVGDYRHAGAKRKNNPPAKIAAEGVVPAIPKAQYAYNPHLSPVLRFDPTGRADTMGWADAAGQANDFETRLSATAEARADELLTAARSRKLTAAEAVVMSALR